MAGEPIVTNESGNDADFRVEGDTDADLLWINALPDRIHIGTKPPEAIATITIRRPDGSEWALHICT